jgi:hypothetical protein
MSDDDDEQWEAVSSLLTMIRAQIPEAKMVNFEGGNNTRFWNIFHSFQEEKKSVIFLTSGAYRFHGGKGDEEDAEVIALPLQDVVIYVSEKGRIAITGDADSIQHWWAKK